MVVQNHQEHINSFRSLFNGREDVFAVRWEKGGTFQNFSEKFYPKLTDEQRRDTDIKLKFSKLGDINPYLRLSISEIGDRDKDTIINSINPKTKVLLHYCIEPKSREEVFSRIGLYNNTKNFQNHFKPLIDAGWLQFTIPEKPSSRDQK